MLPVRSQEPLLLALEEAVEATLDDATPWRVLGDHLQSIGDPRGLLIACHLEAEDVGGAAVEAWVQAANRHVGDAVMEQLFGDLKSRHVRFGLRRGYVDSAVVGDGHVAGATPG